MNISIRQEELLKYIVEDFIANGEPIGSKHLMNKYELDISSATIRNEMKYLESIDFLKKAHLSSGRIPTAKGYEFYSNHLIEVTPDKNLEKRLRNIFAKRTLAIDDALDEALNILVDSTGLTLVASNHEDDELLKSIQLVPLNETNATVVIVTSTGRVESKLISLKNKADLNDVRIAIRLFKDRLIDTPLKELITKAQLLEPILRDNIQNYEYIMQQFLMSVFIFHKNQSSKIYGQKNMIKKYDFNKSQLLHIVNLLETNSIWESIESKVSDDDATLKISVNNDDTAVISKKLVIENSSHEISVLGSSRMEYEKAISILNSIEKFIGHKKKD